MTNSPSKLGGRPWNAVRALGAGAVGVVRLLRPGGPLLRFRHLWKVGLVVVILLGVAYFVRGKGETTVSGTSFTVAKGPMKISVLEYGTVEAIESQQIKCEIKGQTKILSIVDEGYQVTEDDVAKGKVLVTLDNSEILERQTQQEIQYQSALASYTDAREQFGIQIKQNESDVKTAELNAKFARMDFEKYVGVEISNRVIGELGLELPPPMDVGAAAAKLETAEAELATQEEKANSSAKSDASKQGPPPAQAPAAGDSQASGKAAEDGTKAGATDPAASTSVQTASVAADNAPASADAGSTDKPAEESKPAAEETPKKGKKAAKRSDGGDTPKEEALEKEAPEKTEGDSAPPSVEIGPVAAAPASPAIDFAKYVQLENLGDGDAQQKKRKLENDRLLAEKDLTVASTQYEGTKRLAEKQFVTQTDLDRDEIAVKRNTVAVESSKTDEHLFQKYEFPKQAEKLLSDYQEALRKLERVKMEAFSKLAQAKAKFRAAEATYKLQLKQRNELREQIEKCTIRAERPGLVVYAGSGDPWSRQEPVKEGATLYERQDIITIPDMTQMGVNVKVHESAVKSVSKGLKATIKIDAFPDEVFTGEVVKLSVLPDSSRRWMNPDMKLYATMVSVEGTHEGLKPGFSAEVEILVKELADVLYVPIQAVSSSEGDRVCYVAKSLGEPERRVVETGEFNNEFIEIKSGLEEGERVLLRAPEGQEPAKTQEGPQSPDKPGRTRPGAGSPGRGA